MDTVSGGLTNLLFSNDVGGVTVLPGMTMQPLSLGQLPAMGPTPAMVNTVWTGTPLGEDLAGAVPRGVQLAGTDVPG